MHSPSFVTTVVTSMDFLANLIQSIHFKSEEKLQYAHHTQEKGKGKERRRKRKRKKKRKRKETEKEEEGPSKWVSMKGQFSMKANSNSFATQFIRTLRYLYLMTMAYHHII